MNKQTQEALKMAIEYLTLAEIELAWNLEKPINACKEALEQPAQEPVALLTINEHREYDINLLNIETEPHYQALVDMLGIGEHKLYTHPAQPCKECKHDK